MKRCYVVGAYSADNVLEVEANIARGIKAATAVFEEGFAVFCPWFDFHYRWFATRHSSIAEFQAHSMKWLEVADCIIVVPQGAANSKGTQAEIKRATELGIPVFWEDTIEAAIAHAKAHFSDKPKPNGKPKDPAHPWAVVHKSTNSVRVRVHSAEDARRWQKARHAPDLYEVRCVEQNVEAVPCER